MASFTVTKLRRLRENEPDHAARTASVMLPHEPAVPRVAGPSEIVGRTTWGAALAPGTGDGPPGP
ncbi:hypothetical protein ACIBHX_38490 [Nonomuraea sp. NPDC050536]|uniref:hypothetical protein n=1 Tax=Nonomuraea sp. NPDC050536 TaxID=3364366 RepID=UPI0037C61FD9